MDRIQKILSAAGVCSRRLAEEYLRAGRITVNGQTAGVGAKADLAADEIKLDGKTIAAIPPRVYLMLNKPRGYVTTLSDEFGRPTVIDLTADCGERIFPIGRLDRDSDGLLLLTNDGALAERLSHPRYETEKAACACENQRYCKGIRTLDAVLGSPPGAQPPDSPDVSGSKPVRPAPPAGPGGQYPPGGPAPRTVAVLNGRGGPGRL